MMTLVFKILNHIGSLCYASTRSHWPPLSAEKIGLYLSHLVPEICGPKVGQIRNRDPIGSKISKTHSI